MKSDQAMFASALPCNPIPFLADLVEYLEMGGNIQDDKSKRLLWVVNMLAYGQLARIDMCDEYSRLLEEQKVVKMMTMF